MEDFIFRAVRMNDLDDVINLAKSSSGGMTSLPASREWLANQIKKSINSFKKISNVPDNEKYLFVLEDLKSKKVVGLSGIASMVGHEYPYYIYKLGRESVVNQQFDLKYDREILFLVNDYMDVSEIGSLFLHKDYRKYGLGTYLSRIRFLFIKLFQNRFAKTIIANMRGVISKDGISPFWQSLGNNFFHMDYHQAMQKKALTDYQFISDLMPKHPIYLNLLSKKAIKVIGKTHIQTKPALKLLSAEGFSYNHYVDIFDAGPIIEADKTEITTCKKSKKYSIAGKKNKLITDKKYLISNTLINFCSSVTCAELLNKQEIILPETTLSKMSLKIGDEILLV